MPLNWGGISTEGGDMPEDVRQATKSMLDRVGDEVATALQARGIPLHRSPLFRPFSLTVARDDVKVLVGFSTSTGIPERWWIEQAGILDHNAISQFLQEQQGKDVLAVLSLPRPDAPHLGGGITVAAAAHVAEIERQSLLGSLGDISHVPHLEPHLRSFLADHPDHDRNVFVMMRFNNSEQMTQVYASIKSALAARGMTAIRADDRDYTGELWSNIEVYLTGCKYGIAVFEDIDQRDYNPNVSLELGYLMGRGKRTLLLKEQRLPRLPTDVVHRLYKEFDMFDIQGSIDREVGRWIDVDLRVGR